MQRFAGEQCRDNRRTAYNGDFTEEVRNTTRRINILYLNDATFVVFFKYVGTNSLQSSLLLLLLLLGVVVAETLNKFSALCVALCGLCDLTIRSTLTFTTGETTPCIQRLR